MTSNSFCILRRATAKSKSGIDHGYGLVEAPPVFQAGAGL
jgi:hypothetical protein